METTPSAGRAAHPAPGLPFARLFPIAALTFVDVLGLTIILPLLHLYALRFGASPLEVGLVAAAFPLAQVVGVPVMGALSDRYGRKPLLVISQITTFVSFLMLAFAPSLHVVLLSRVIDGLFGANLATAQAAAADLTTPEQRARGLGMVGASFGLGFLFGPAIALAALEVSNELALPALIAAAYSFASILITLFVFRETLPPEARSARAPVWSAGARMLRKPRVPLLVALVFGEQLAFFAFESLLGLFMLNRLGLLGQGSALVFVYVGVLLVFVQVRVIGRWVRRWGEARLVPAALALLAVGLLAVAFTPEMPQPFYIQARVEREMAELALGGTEAGGGTAAIIGTLGVSLPSEAGRGLGGIVWLMVALVPIAIGSGLMRPLLNALLIRQAGGAGHDSAAGAPVEIGAILGVSAAAATAANAAAPILGGLLYQTGGPSVPFVAGAVWLAVLAAAAFAGLRGAAAVSPTGPRA